MEIIEHKIGETFCLEDGTKLQVVKSTCNCKDCYFNSKNNICSRTKDIICSNTTAFLLCSSIKKALCSFFEIM